MEKLKKEIKKKLENQAWNILGYTCDGFVQLKKYKGKKEKNFPEWMYEEEEDGSGHEALSGRAGRDGLMIIANFRADNFESDFCDFAKHYHVPCEIDSAIGRDTSEIRGWLASMAEALAGSGAKMQKEKGPCSLWKNEIAEISGMEHAKQWLLESIQTEKDKVEKSNSQMLELGKVLDDLPDGLLLNIHCFTDYQFRKEDTERFRRIVCRDAKKMLSDELKYLLHVYSIQSDHDYAGGNPKCPLAILEVGFRDWRF